MEEKKDEKKEKAGFICSRDTLDGAYPALLMAINAVRLGMECKIFYTFMGLNLLLKDGFEKSKFIPPGVMGAIPGMSSMATAMMKKKMDKANIPNLTEVQEMAQLEGVEFIACRMTVDMMEISSDQFIDGVSIWTAEEFIKYAMGCKISLFT